MQVKPHSLGRAHLRRQNMTAAQGRFPIATGSPASSPSVREE